MLRRRLLRWKRTVYREMSVCPTDSCDLEEDLRDGWYVCRKCGRCEGQLYASNSYVPDGYSISDNNRYRLHKGVRNKGKRLKQHLNQMGFLTKTEIDTMVSEFFSSGFTLYHLQCFHKVPKIDYKILARHLYTALGFHGNEGKFKYKRSFEMEQLAMVYAKHVSVK